MAKAKLKVASTTLKIWAGSIIILLLTFAISHLAPGALPFDLTIGWMNGFLLIVAALTLVVEIFMEGKKFNIKNPVDLIAGAFIFFSFVAALGSFGYVTLPPLLLGAIGVIFIVDALLVGMELLK